MDSAFLNLVRGNRTSAMIGLKLSPGEDGIVPPPKYGPGYLYIEVPVKDVLKDGSPVEEGKISRNQHVFIAADCTIMPRRASPVLVEYNKALAEVASIGSMHLVHPGEGEQVPGFWATFRKDYLVSDITYAVRLYLIV